jgi:transposase-like protein
LDWGHVWLIKLPVHQQAYIDGASTRRVDDLVQALGLQGIDKSLVSRSCKELDGLVTEFRNRPLTQCYPYVWLDAIEWRLALARELFALRAAAQEIATGL